ncbi:MAG: hypothetical protein ABIT58_08145 [Ferruginibacter sp.]
MNRIQRTVLLLALSFLHMFNSFAQGSEVFSLSFPKQYAAVNAVVEKAWNKNPLYDTVLVKTMEVAAYKTQAELTILNFKRTVLNYKYMCTSYDGPPESYKGLIDEALHLLAETDATKYPEIAAMINITLANTYYFKIKDYASAFESYLRAYDLFKNVTVEKFPDRQYAQYSIAMAFYQFNDLDKAISLGKELESIYQQKNYISIFTVDMIGMSYLRKMEYDSAIVQFEWILNNKNYALNVGAWEGIAAGNIGNAYFMEGKYEKAIPWLEKGVALSDQENLPDNLAGFAAQLTVIYSKQNQLDLAKKYMEIARKAAYEDNSATNFQRTYAALSGYYQASGDPAKALEFLDSSIFFRDSLSKITDINLKYQGEMAVEIARRSQQQKIMEQERSTQKIVRNGLVILIFLAMVVGLLLYNRIRLKNRHQQLLLISDKQVTETALTNAKTQLNGFTRSIKEKNELIEKATAEIEQIKTAYQELLDRQPGLALPEAPIHHSLKMLEDSVLLTDDDWKNFTLLFETVYPGFFIRLKEKFVGLSPAETRFVTLSKLKLNNKEMAGMLGVSTDAIRQSRSRMRKKLNLAEDASLEEAIDVI